jgi:lipopolysaccharide export LptBFGC system permease protein LptF
MRRHATAFAVSLVSLTALLLANYAVRRVPQLGVRGVRSVFEVLLLSVPFTAAITIPMAVFVAVLWVFTRLGADGTLTAAREERYAVRRLVTPVLGAVAVVAALTLAWNAEVVPRANARLATAISGNVAERTDRMMTIGELRAAARRARADGGSAFLARVASYEVEIQKKYALAAACVVLALVAVAIALRVPSGGTGLVIGASLATFSAYYICLVAGETLADRGVVSPFAAMWMANALLLGVALLVARWRRSPRAPGGAKSIAVGA